MTVVRFAIHHAWWFIGLATVIVMLGVIFRKRVARAIRIAKALATDQRLPRHVRWLFRLALLVKCSPVDFGIDEALLAIGVLLLVTRHRDTWRAIRAESRSTATASGFPTATSAPPA